MVPHLSRRDTQPQFIAHLLRVEPCGYGAALLCAELSHSDAAPAQRDDVVYLHLL